MIVCFSVFWRQCGKFPSFPLYVTKDAVGEDETEIKDPSDAKSACWACFWYRAKARRLSFPSSYVSSGTQAKDFKLFPFPCQTAACCSFPGGLFLVRRRWFPLSFDCHSWLPPSFDCEFSIPPSLVPSLLFFSSFNFDPCYDGLVGIPSGVSGICYLHSPDVTPQAGYSKSRLVIRRVPDLSRGGVFSIFFQLFDNPRRDWHDGSTVTPWP